MSAEDAIKAKIDVSSAWVARAIWVLADIKMETIIANDMNVYTDQANYVLLEETLSTSKKFFEELKAFYVEKGYFSSRQIYLARKNFHELHYEYLAALAAMNRNK